MKQINRPSLTVLAPGRMNLIGEHIDYSGGFVLPAAIDKFIKIKLERHQQDYCIIHSDRMETSEKIDLKQLKASKPAWLNYIKGVVYHLNLRRPNQITGFDAWIESNLPIGAGISSSAALECGIAVGLNELFGLKIPKYELIELCMQAEHEFAGTLCGIMDQFSVMMGQQNHLLQLDCKTNKHRLIPAQFGPWQFVLLHSKVQHQLADSAYNDRRKSCEQVLNTIQKSIPKYQYLCEIPFEVLANFKATINPQDFKRATYAIEENARTLAVVEHLHYNDFEAVGACMLQSHRGLQHQYEVSCSELDFMVDTACQFEGVLGARMMGGGFGGCSLNLVHKERKQAFIEHMHQQYFLHFDRSLEPIEISITDGVKTIKNG